MVSTQARGLGGGNEGCVLGSSMRRRLGGTGLGCWGSLTLPNDTPTTSFSLNNCLLVAGVWQCFEELSLSEPENSYIINISLIFVTFT